MTAYLFFHRQSYILVELWGQEWTSTFLCKLVLQVKFILCSGNGDTSCVYTKNQWTKPYIKETPQNSPSLNRDESPPALNKNCLQGKARPPLCSREGASRLCHLGRTGIYRRTRVSFSGYVPVERRCLVGPWQWCCRRWVQVGAIVMAGNVAAATGVRFRDATHTLLFTANAAIASTITWGSGSFKFNLSSCRYLYQEENLVVDHDINVGPCQRGYSTDDKGRCTSMRFVVKLSTAAS